MQQHKPEELAEFYFPKHEFENYHEGMGDLEPRAEPYYGKRKLVYRTPFDCDRETAIARAEARGVKYETVFATARYWCFALYE